MSNLKALKRVITKRGEPAPQRSAVSDKVLRVGYITSPLIDDYVVGRNPNEALTVKRRAELLIELGIENNRIKAILDDALKEYAIKKEDYDVLVGQLKAPATSKKTSDKGDS